MKTNEFFTADEIEAADNGITEAELLQHIFGRTNGCDPWRRCEYNPVYLMARDGERTSLQCTAEAANEVIIEDQGQRLQLWLCDEHEGALINTISCAHLKTQLKAV